MQVYTTEELLTLLGIFTTDFNRIPTKRAIQNDKRLPTFHTYYHRFGNVREALKQAGIRWDMTSSWDYRPKVDAHELLRMLLQQRGFEAVDEWVSIGPAKADFRIRTKSGKEYVIDVVDGSLWEDQNAFGQMVRMREEWGKGAYGDNYRLVPVANISDVLDEIEEA